MNSSKRKLFSLILLGVLGIPVSAQDIDTVYKNTPIEQVFSDLREKTNHEFVYQKQILQGVKPVTCTLKDKRLEEVLNEVLKGTGLTYEIVDNTVIIRKAETNRKTQQTHRIYGTVISKDDGLPIIGASVRLLGADNEETTFGTATDIDGRFEITGFTFGANYKVQISYIGMKTQVLAANADMHVVLESDAQKLQDVVVTGIFKKAKESYTGAVSTVTSEELDMFKGQNLLQTLKNIDASLNFAVNNIAGSNPNALPQINIRGNSSLPMSVQEFNESASNAVNTPLIIMDGFEISLEKLMDYNDEENRVHQYPEGCCCHCHLRFARFERRHRRRDQTTRAGQAPRECRGRSGLRSARPHFLRHAECTGETGAGELPGALHVVYP